MTYADVVSQMQSIRTQLLQLNAAQTGSADSATSAAGFASALSGASTATGASATASTSPTDGTTIASNGVTGDDVVQAALQYKGVPYVLGGESKSGIDCSGLVQATFKDLGVNVPRLVHEQKTIGQKVDSLKDAKPGDLIVLNGGDHIAIWAGNDTVIHAPYPGRTVSVQKAWFTDKDVTAIRRVVPATDDATSSTTAASSGTTSTSGVSAATLAQAVGMLGLAGSSDSSSDGSGDGSSSGTSSIASMLSSFGLGGGSSSTSQQLVAAQSALLGTGSA